jgi:hypothetical protein
MLLKSYGVSTLTVFFLSVSAQAGGLDMLKGKYAFNWREDPALTKCAKITGPLFNEIKSSRFHCDLKPKSNTSTDVPARSCSEGENGKEYLIFDTKKACEDERETQASNE